MNDCGPGLGCQILDVAAWAAQPLFASIAESASGIADRFPAFWPLVAACVGAILASFYGMLLDRVPRIHGWHGKKERGLTLWSPGSHCESCKTPLPAYALIPVVGWFLVKGRCESCGAKAPILYPAVEGVTALLSMVIAFEFGPTFQALSACLLLWALVLVAWLDWREKVIPDGLSVPIAFAGLLFSPFEPDAWARIAGAAMAGGCMWGTFRLMTAIRREDTMAYGDVALAAACGSWIGFCATPALLMGTVIAYLAYAGPLRYLRGEIWVPMAPAISAAAMTVIATGIKIAI